MLKGWETMSVRSQRNRLKPGEVVAIRELPTVSGARLPMPAPDQLIHLQFRRFAGCPVCNLHLQSFARRAADLAAAGISEVVVFHSPAEELVRYTGDLPFAIIADPDKRLYAAFGVEAAPRALLDPRAWPGILKAVAHSAAEIVRGRPVPPLFPHGGRLGLPADFLIAPDGRVLAVKYGQRADDQWSVDEVVAHAAGHGLVPTDRRHANAMTGGPHGLHFGGPGKKDAVRHQLGAQTSVWAIDTQVTGLEAGTWKRF
jgi:peroxiredoxin